MMATAVSLEKTLGENVELYNSFVDRIYDEIHREVAYRPDSDSAFILYPQISFFSVPNGVHDLVQFSVKVSWFVVGYGAFVDQCAPRETSEYHEWQPYECCVVFLKVDCALRRIWVQLIVQRFYQWGVASRLASDADFLLEFGVSKDLFRGLPMRTLHSFLELYPNLFSSFYILLQVVPFMISEDDAKLVRYYRRFGFEEEEADEEEEKEKIHDAEVWMEASVEKFTESMRRSGLPLCVHPMFCLLPKATELLSIHNFLGRISPKRSPHMFFVPEPPRRGAPFDLSACRGLPRFNVITSGVTPIMPVGGRFGASPSLTPLSPPSTPKRNAANPFVGEYRRRRVASSSTSSKKKKPGKNEIAVLLELASAAVRDDDEREVWLWHVANLPGIEAFRGFTSFPLAEIDEDEVVDTLGSVLVGGS